MSTNPFSVSPRTVIEGCFSPSGVAELSLVYDLGLALGIAEQTIRLTIRRMQVAGQLRQEGRGRSGALIRSDDATRRGELDGELMRFAFAQDAGASPWNGEWHLYAFSIPESDRAERDALRGALVSLGAAPLVPGLYVAAHSLDAELAAALPTHDLDSRLIRSRSAHLTVPGCESPQDIAEHLWPAHLTLEAYRPLEWLLAHDEGLAAILTGHQREQRATAVAAEALKLAEGLGQALQQDPLLPIELRNTPWQPTATRATFLEAWSKLQSLAPELPMFQAPATS